VLGRGVAKGTVKWLPVLKMLHIFLLLLLNNIKSILCRFISILKSLELGFILKQISFNIMFWNVFI